MTDPKVSIRNLLKTNWVAANVSSITPNCHTGWYDTKSNLPQITVTDTSEVVEAGGIAGYTGIATNGTPAKLWVGTASVNLWVTREAVSINPKQCLFEMRKEIERIIKAGYADVSDLDYLSWKGGFEQVEADQSPVVYRWVGEIGYAYLD